MRFPEGFKPPSDETIARVNNPDTFVVATWNGIPADNSGRRLVMYLTDQMNAMGMLNRWSPWRSDAQQYASADDAEQVRLAIKLPHLRELAKVYRNTEAHVMTGGLEGYELT
jgi:hypothetical protein